MNTSTIVIASISRQELNLWVNGSIATMIAGAAFFFCGAIVGWWLWRKARQESEDIKNSNRQLVFSYKDRSRDFRQMKDRLATVMKPDHPDFR